jgi:Ca2+-binding EF-hand superfamily protein
MRRAFLFVLLVAAISMIPSASWSQGKKGGGPGGGNFNPDEAFNKLSGGKDFIVISELDKRQQFGLQFIAQNANITGDRITREQYKSAMENMATMFKKGADAGGGQKGGGGFGGGQGGGGFGGGQGGGGFGGGRGGPPGGLTLPPPGNVPTPPSPINIGPPGGNNQSNDANRNADIDARAEKSFRDRDKDNDGFLRFEEMSEQLQNERDTYDTNKDGFIDLAEFKAYMRNRFARKDNPAATDRPANADEKKTPENNPPVGIDTPPPYKEDPRPQVFRAGKLPAKELPDWFIRLDKEGDNDGQVGLYEWKTLGKGVEEFNAMDLNGDGLLTAEEYLRWKGMQKKTTPDGADVATDDGSANSQDRNRPGPQQGNGSPRFGGGGPPNNGFGPPMGDNGAGRFGQPNGGGRFGQPKGGDNGGNTGNNPFGGGRFGQPKGGDNANNGNAGNGGNGGNGNGFNRKGGDTAGNGINPPRKKGN